MHGDTQALFDAPVSICMPSRTDVKKAQQTRRIKSKKVHKQRASVKNMKKIAKANPIPPAQPKKATKKLSALASSLAEVAYSKSLDVFFQLPLEQQASLFAFDGDSIDSGLGIRRMRRQVKKLPPELLTVVSTMAFVESKLHSSKQQENELVMLFNARNGEMDLLVYEIITCMC